MGMILLDSGNGISLINSSACLLAGIKDAGDAHNAYDLPVFGDILKKRHGRPFRGGLQHEEYGL